VIEYISTEKSPLELGAFSQAVKAGGFLITSGIAPVDPSTWKVIGDTVEEQVRICYEHLKVILEAAGASMGDLVKVNVYLADIDDYPAVDRLWGELFPRPRPCRGLHALPWTKEKPCPGWEGIFVELSAIAYLG
jgi:2-iminobutanoate/2-iminopropanoate deaminase